MKRFFKRTQALTASAIAAMALLTGIAWADEPVLQFRSVKSAAGITFLHRYDPTTPFAAINFGMRDFYTITTKGKEGLSALGGAMIMQGADGAGQTEFIERLKDLAASASISLGPFVTQGSVRAPAATLAQATAMLAAALRHAEPSDKVMARLKQQAIGGEAQAATRAETIAQRSAMRLALGDHPIVRGFDPTRFERVTRDDLSDWRNRVLDRAKLKVAVSGRIDESKAKLIVDEAFAILPSRHEPIRFEWPTVTVPSTTVVIEHDTAQSAVVMIGQTTISGGAELEIATLANAVLGGGGGGSSRLWQAVREKLGSTYGAGSGFVLAGPGNRMIRIGAAVANDQVKDSITALRSAYATWHSEGVTVDELKAASTRLITEFKSAFDDPARANSQAVGVLLSNRSVDELTSYDRRIAAITREQLNTFIANKFPAPEKLLIVVATPRSEGLGANCTVRSQDEIERCRVR